MGSQIWLQIIYIVFMKKNIFILLALGNIACGARELMLSPDFCPALTLIGELWAQQRMYVAKLGYYENSSQSKWKAIYKNDIYFSF